MTPMHLVNVKRLAYGGSSMPSPQKSGLPGRDQIAAAGRAGLRAATRDAVHDELGQCTKLICKQKVTICLCGQQRERIPG